MSSRGILLGVGAIFWIAAVGCWLRSHGTGRLSREAGLFLVLGLPFLIAGFFHTASSYPPEARPAVPPSDLAATSGPAPELVPAQPSPPLRTHAEAVAASQAAAVARYPDLGKAGTRFNASFLAAYRRLRVDDPAYLTDPDWPLHLAERLARGESARR